MSSFAMPTLISTSVILNGVIRAAENAAEKLGPEYFSVIQKDFSSGYVRVYRSEPRGASEPLELTQSVPKMDDPIWSMKVDEYKLKNSPGELSAIFTEIPPRYFFLSEDEALSYIDSLEAAVVASVLQSAAQIDQNGDS